MRERNLSDRQKPARMFRIDDLMHGKNTEQSTSKSIYSTATQLHGSNDVQSGMWFFYLGL